MPTFQLALVWEKVTVYYHRHSEGSSQDLWGTASTLPVAMLGVEMIRDCPDSTGPINGINSSGT